MTRALSFFNCPPITIGMSSAQSTWAEELREAPLSFEDEKEAVDNAFSQSEGLICSFPDTRILLPDTHKAP